MHTPNTPRIGTKMLELTIGFVSSRPKETIFEYSGIADLFKNLFTYLKVQD